MLITEDLFGWGDWGLNFGSTRIEKIFATMSYCALVVCKEI